MSWFKQQAIKLAFWIIRQWHEQPIEGDVAKRCRELIRWADQMAAGTSGEYKRHEVLAKLKKEFPLAKHVGLLIEQLVILEHGGSNE